MKVSEITYARHGNMKVSEITYGRSENITFVQERYSDTYKPWKDKIYLDYCMCKKVCNNMINLNPT